MSEILQAIVLPSGLGVRFRDLTPTQGDGILVAAAKEIPPDGTVGQLLAIEAKLGYEAMVQEVTSGPCAKKPITREVEDPATKEKAVVVVGEESDVNSPANNWRPFDPDATSPFSNKDHALLKSLYMDRNKTAPGEVASILGKAVSVVK